MATQRVVKSAAGAAELLRHDQAEQPEVAHLAGRGRPGSGGPGPTRDVRRDLGLGEVAHHGAELLVVLAELEHGLALRGRRGSPDVA